MTLDVRRIRPDEGARLRTLRLRALADTPSAFGSTLAREEAFAQEVWHQRARHGAAGEDRVTYVADAGDRWIGMATGILDGEGRQPWLVGMFVDPDARRLGVGVALVEAVVDWAQGRGAAHLHLYVTSINRAAIGLYRRCGFTPTGKAKPLDHTPELTELEMMRAL